MTFHQLIRDLRTCIRRATPRDGIGIRTEATEAGVRLHLDAEALPGVVPGAGRQPACITGGGPGSTYTADLYAAGTHASATREGIAVTILQLAAGEQIPTGTWLFVTRHGDTWYAQVPVWL